MITLTPPATPALPADGQPVFSIQSGRLRGTRAGGVASFKRVPYAANPFTAANRFQAPKPVAPWDGIRDATAFGLAPPQPSRDPQAVLFGGCDDLTLNIWTPDPSTKGLPVMVWIPGGAFIRADASEPAYDGDHFAVDGIVVVTVNYRVGVDGFMAIEGAPANRGLLDQIAALKWVRDNIAAFGGDAANVTLFGQSAGAESAAILLASPKTEGLFKRVILQSPPMQAMSSADGKRLAAVFAKGLGVAPTVDGLAGVPLDKLIDAGTKLATAIKDPATWGKLSLGGTAFLPVIDGDVLDASPIDMLARGPKPGVPVIVGSTDEEARIYMVPGDVIDHIQQQAIDQFIGALKLPADTLDIYRTKPANVTIGDLYTALQSDYTFRMPALRIAELRSSKWQTWHYNFSWRSPGFGGRLGAAHFVDVPFSFDTLSSDQAKAFVGSNPPASLAEAMHGAWVAFAKTGDPGWPAYDLTTRLTKRFDATSSLVADPEKATRGLWKDVAF
ncbi:carboxylesterase/lipase family protein [Achromobacter piechaudii]|uniref:Carboxylic ester hydrolase n=1 Tax=Achromobacter piechaudii TaxID=72556 RepID=A0ABN7F8C4_9BURK|nr:carboxylesterase family protein [Achromobacter piechaudii]CAB3730819.1 Carboxylesterase [Achromobacter piechaudii]CAB3908135.1 Carboxylesterase [Achromobacter piechaudii]CAB3954496.1 Carboxylesterase [Achromobacter piechaudii]